MDELRDEWEHKGYAVLRGAVPAETLAAFAEELAAVREGLLVRAAGDDQVSLATAHEPGAAVGAVDPYAISVAAREVLLAPRVIELLRAVYGGDEGAPPLLFDAVGAGAGAPEPGRHRDATFTALADEPETLVTLAVATGDAASVVVFLDSAGIATAPFSGRYRHFNVERDGERALEQHRAELADALGEGAPTDRVELAAGDVVVWSANVVHEPVTGDALVAHFCPSRVAPGWFAYRPERAVHALHADGAAWLASQHYDLIDAVAADPEAPTGIQGREELARVEDALREHDEELATGPGQPPPGAASDTSEPGGPRRSGGLVDSVRGMLGRRGRRAP